MPTPYKKRFGQVSWFWYSVARLYAWLFGWKIVGEVPPDPKMIGIIAPHTSNWDVFMLYIMADSFRIKSNWLAKDALLRPPIGWLLRPLGAIPVVRTKHQNMTDAAAELFKHYDNLYLAIAPEGTRHRVEHWRTGFYQIAMKANVKIVMMYIDYKKKEAGFGPILTPSGDMEKDFEILRSFYEKVTPLHPGEFGPVCFKKSDGPEKI